MTKKMWNLAALLAIAAVGGVLAGCGSGGGQNAGGEGSGQASGESKPSNLTGKVMIDGSSTVFPISQAVAEEFQKANSGVQVTVAESGTSGGFKKFIAGEIDICDASRPIDASEIEKAKAAGVEFIEIPIAFDGLSVVVNPKNDFVDKLTVAELKKMWEPNSKVKTWADVRAGWPAEPIKLFGAGADSGTFDYFTEAIVGEKRASRQDYQSSEDDNILVQGVAGEQYALGYFGYAYYAENQDKVKLVPIDNGAGGVEPSPETIMNNSYAPLSRPLLMYVNVKALDRPEVKAYLDFYFANAKSLIEAVRYIPLPDEVYALVKKHVDEKKTGSRMQGDIVGKPMTEILAREAN